MRAADLAAGGIENTGLPLDRKKPKRGMMRARETGASSSMYVCMYVYRLAVGRLDPMDRQAIPAAEGIGGEDRGGGGRRSLLESGGVVWAGEFGCGLLGVVLRVPPPPPVSSQPPAGLAGEHFIAAGGGSLS